MTLIRVAVAPLRGVVLSAVILCGAAAIPAEGQGWTAEASAGSATYEAIPGSPGSVSAILGVRRGAPAWVSVSAALPLDSAGTPWASAALGRRWSRAVGRVRLGVDATGVGFGYRLSESDGTGGGATLAALPFVAFGNAKAGAELHVGLTHHAGFHGDTTVARSILDSGADLTVDVAPGLSLGGDGRWVVASEGSYHWTGLSAEFARGPASITTRGGTWWNDALGGAGWAIAGRLSLPHAFGLYLRYERLSGDPLYWNGPRRGWTVGVSRQVGGRERSGSLPPPPDFLRLEEGNVLVTVPADEVRGGTPSVAGDFTDWRLVPMTLRGRRWEARFTLPPGVYRYSLQSAEGRWFLPESVTNRVDDGFGGSNGVLVVR